jgi:hypothetical protein
MLFAKQKFSRNTIPRTKLGKSPLVPSVPGLSRHSLGDGGTDRTRLSFVPRSQTQKNAAF